MLTKRWNIGFSLIEIIVVISIITTLSGIGFTAYAKYSQRANDDRRMLDVAILQEALGRYHSNQIGGFYPLNLNELVTGGYLDKRPIDPLTDQQDDYQYAPLPAGCNNLAGNFCTNYLIVVDLETKGDRYEAGSKDLRGTIIP
ncbi:MAG: prepilin-type N-terminal cleavage/methylation domain-containing protein [Candidatus Roizmanbacteria bacterium]|nr:prepilin-type N-terminal cleavage/methylation domain-containing protein [Candidatus Roizmanbacteria bacterium]